jgi:succinyl-diaminopimelate desuccinylase
VGTDPHLATRLAERTLELVNIASVSRQEAAVMRAVRGLIPDRFEIRFDDGDALVAATPRQPDRPLVILAGHVDTVPAQGNFPGAVTDTEVIGLGASDMKGGIAVMLELAHWIADEDPDRAVDVALVVFTREELPVAESPVPAAFAACPWLAGAALAIVLEPTDNTVQAGCVGNLNGTLRFRGRAAHSARPWTGDNAINRAVAGLANIVATAPRTVEIEGLPYTEVVSVTRISGGVADNVIPDLVECHVNYRFTPDRGPEEAAAYVRRLVGDAGELEITSIAPSGAVAPPSALLDRLIAAGGFDVLPKQAWTPVAQFTQEGIDAVNLGPGATALAHTREERIGIDALLRTYTALQRFIAADAGGGA